MITKIFVLFTLMSPVCAHALDGETRDLGARNPLLTQGSEDEVIETSEVELTDQIEGKSEVSDHRLISHLKRNWKYYLTGALVAVAGGSLLYKVFSERCPEGVDPEDWPELLKSRKIRDRENIRLAKSMRVQISQKKSFTDFIMIFSPGDYDAEKREFKYPDRLKGLMSTWIKNGGQLSIDEQ